MTAAPITPVEAVPLLDRSAPLATTAAPNPSAQPLAAAATSFSQMLTNGIESINQKQIDADNMVRAFALDDSPSQHDRLQFTWRYETAWTLLWALGFVAQLGKPAQICDVEFAVRTMTETTTSQFIEDSKLRPTADILDQADLI